MKTEEPFYALAEIVTNFAKKSQKPLTTDHFIEAMKEQARVKGEEIKSSLSNKVRWSAKFSHAKSASGNQSLEIAHTVILDKASIFPDPEAGIFKITVKGSWVEPPKTNMTLPEQKKEIVNYSLSYSTREFAPPFISSVPDDLVSRVLKLAGKAIGVGVISPETPVTRARTVRRLSSTPS